VSARGFTKKMNAPRRYGGTVWCRMLAVGLAVAIFWVASCSDADGSETFVRAHKATSEASSQVGEIEIDAGKAGPKINPKLYGVFLEEINHAIDGGLYAEMIQNRGFEDSKAPEGFTFEDHCWRNPGGYATIFDWEPDKSIPYWSLVSAGDARGSMSLDMTNVWIPRHHAHVGSTSRVCLRGTWVLPKKDSGA